jgi:heat shock protein HslJ
MRRVLGLLLVWQCVSLEAALVGGADPARAPASAVMGSGPTRQAAANLPEWNRVTEQEWLVLELDGRPVLDGTAITVIFRPSGRLSGNAGTNNYMGAYQRTGAGAVAMSNLGATKMYLDLPPGRMRQETKYLDALRSVDRFTLEDDELTLWAGGEPLIRYTHAK